MGTNFYFYQFLLFGFINQFGGRMSIIRFFWEEKNQTQNVHFKNLKVYFGKK
jgi:hypothetical protein